MNESRIMREDEIFLLKCLLENTEYGDIDLTERKVMDMEDGGMGSIRFIYEINTPRRMGRQLCERQFNDSDGVLISVTVNVDQYGDLFELDIWKVDFKPVLTYPRC